MSSLLEQLENNEAILLMYLAGELSPADHAEVEQMLQRDDGLRAQLAELTAANQSVTQMLSRQDGVGAPGVSRREAAVRSVSRAFVAARIQQLTYATSSIRSGRSPLKLRKFILPAAIAAGLVIGVLLWPRTIQLPGPQAPNYVDFPDVFALDLKPETQPDPLSDLEQELLSLGEPPPSLGGDAWDLTEEQ
jgi:anti-sigma factor RsiW